jgi:signal transduction histidine kinase
MPTPPWSTQQLAEFLAVVSTCTSEPSAALVAVERTAEALDAEVAAIVHDGAVVAAVGYPDGSAPLADLLAVAHGEDSKLDIPGVGISQATAVPLEHPSGAAFILARSGSDRLVPEEASMLRGMARVTSMTMRMLRLLDDERAAREESERQAAENARLLEALTERQAELAASRARIVAAADEARRRIERDLHDGIQQRLVTLALEMKPLAETVLPERRDLAEELSRLGAELNDVLDELRETSHGVHPAILSKGGLALKALARRSALPLQLDVATVERFPESIEVAAYYAVSEAVANALKHASASTIRVELEAHDGAVHLSIRDDGIGGADPQRGSGLLGLKDRIEALGGTLVVTSAPGDGTSIVLDLPIERI